MAHSDPGPILIDGSQGEGGGQILRTALGLSLVTGRPFRIEKIRANRDKPGLRLQHLTAVNAAAEIGRAAVEGAAVDSQQLLFTPRGAAPGAHRFSIATAGSTTLVLQTVLPPLLTGDKASVLHFTGGTHNPFAPPFDFLASAFLPLVSRMGPRIDAELHRHGFYPNGGGEWSVRIEPASRLTALTLVERGPVRRRLARAALAGVPRHVGERELSVVAEALGWGPGEGIIEELPAEHGPGNVLTLEVSSDTVTEVFTGFGQRGIRAETVARRAADDARRYLASDAPVGECLADQLLVPMALAAGSGGVSSFRTLPLSLHARTNMEVIRLFLPVEFSTQEHEDGTVTVAVRPSGGVY